MKKNMVPPKRASKAKPTEELKKVGRKPWIPDYDKIEQWSLQGLSDKEIAALSGVSHTVFCTKKTELPELRSKLEYGRAKGAAVVSQKLLQLGMSGDRQALTFYLARRCGWTETTRLELPTTKPMHEMSEEELHAIIEGREI